VHKNYLSLILSISIVLLAPSLTCRAEQYLFLVGVQDHANPSNSSTLRYAEQDVHTLADLYTKAGVPSRDILLMTHRPAAFDPNLIPRSGLIRANFEQFLRKLGPEDSIIVGLSDHGVQFKGDEYSFLTTCESRKPQLIDRFAAECLLPPQSNIRPRGPGTRDAIGHLGSISPCHNRAGKAGRLPMLRCRAILSILLRLFLKTVLLSHKASDWHLTWMDFWLCS